MPLLLIYKTDTVATTSRGLAPLLHGGQPGHDDWFPVLAFALGLLLFIGFAIYNLKKQPPATPDKVARERNR